MKKILTAPGVIVGAVALASAVAKAAGYPIVGLVLDDPHTVDVATNAITGLGAVLAGALAGVNHKPAA